MSLGTGAIKGCWGSCENTLHSREVPWQPCDQESASQLATNEHFRIEETTAEIQYLPNLKPTLPNSFEGWERLGA